MTPRPHLLPMPLPRRVRPVHPTPYTLHHTPYTIHSRPCTLHHRPYTLHHTPYTTHHTPFTLRPTPYTTDHTPYTLHPTPHTTHLTPYTLRHTSNNIHHIPTPHTIYNTSYTTHHTPHTTHHTPYTIHHTPCIIHHTPYTIHPTPYTRHLTPYNVHHTPHTIQHTPYSLGLRVSAKPQTGFKQEDPSSLHSMLSFFSSKFTFAYACIDMTIETPMHPFTMIDMRRRIYAKRDQFSRCIPNSIILKPKQTKSLILKREAAAAEDPGSLDSMLSFFSTKTAADAPAPGDPQTGELTPSSSRNTK